MLTSSGKRAVDNTEGFLLSQLRMVIDNQKQDKDNVSAKPEDKQANNSSEATAKKSSEENSNEEQSEGDKSENVASK